MFKPGVDLIPDKEQELARHLRRPGNVAFYLAIQQGPGEGHDQYVDDMFTTKDGQYLAVSRPSFADVVWIDIAKAVAGSPAASSASSRWTATAPTTWGSRPTDGGCWSATPRRAR